MVFMARRLDSFEAQNHLLSLVVIHSGGLLYRKSLQIDEVFNKESFGKIGSAGGKSQAISSDKERRAIP